MTTILKSNRTENVFSSSTIFKITNTDKHDLKNRYKQGFIRPFMDTADHTAERIYKASEVIKFDVSNYFVSLGLTTKFVYENLFLQEFITNTSEEKQFINFNFEDLKDCNVLYYPLLKKFSITTNKQLKIGNKNFVSFSCQSTVSNINSYIKKSA